MMLYLLLIVGMLNNAADDAKIEQVETEARQYRIHIYETYRTDRTQYDARIAASDELLDKWRAANHPIESAEAIEAWFAEARDAEHIADLPALPHIEPAVVVELTPDTEAPEGFQQDDAFTLTTTDDQASDDLGPLQPSSLSGELFSTSLQPTWAPPTPRPWRSLGNAIWVGFEKSID